MLVAQILEESDRRSRRSSGSRLEVRGTGGRPPEEAALDRDGIDRLERAVAHYQQGVEREREAIFIDGYCRPRLERYFLKRRVRPPAHEDLTQQTLDQTFLSLDGGRFRGDGPFLAYVYTTARNVLSRWREKQEKERGWVSLEDGEDPIDPPEDERPTPEDEAVDASVKASVRAALAGLSPRRRACVELRFFQDLPYREIASILGITVGAVGAHLDQARDQLKKLIGDRLDMDDGWFGDRRESSSSRQPDPSPR